MRLVSVSLLLPRVCPWPWLCLAQCHSKCSLSHSVSLCPGRLRPTWGGWHLTCGLLLAHQEWPAPSSSCTPSVPIAGLSLCSTSPGWCLTGTRPRKVRAWVSSPRCPALGTFALAHAEPPHCGCCLFLLNTYCVKHVGLDRGWLEWGA